MGVCDLCHRREPQISAELGLCMACVRSRPQAAWRQAEAVHAGSRVPFGLPEKPPAAADGVACDRCANRCVVPESGLGYCGARANRGGRLTGASAAVGNLSWYHDALPTNCVASHVCAAETGAGFPRFSNRSGPETGFTNLAVFFRACNFNCRF